MKRVLVAAVAIAMSPVVSAQDPVRVSASNYRVVTENASVRILRVSVPAGGKTAVHSHPDAVVIPLVASKVRFTLPDGKNEDADLANESAQYTPAGTHTGTNLGTNAVDAIVVEFKTPAPGKATIPASREGITTKMLAEGPRAVVHRSTAAANFQEPAGSKHEFDQVVIALGAAQMSLTLDGQPAKTTWTRGEAVFIPRGTAHESKNTSGRPVDFIIVAIR